MSSARRLLCTSYYALAIVALVATWRQNLAFGRELQVGPVELFVKFFPALLVNRATMSITVDIVLLTLAGVVFMVLEARRLHIRGVWIYVALAIVIAMSVMFPLFLAARERRLAATEAASTEPAPTASDKLGLAIVGAAAMAFVISCTLR